MTTPIPQVFGWLTRNSVKTVCCCQVLLTMFVPIMLLRILLIKCPLIVIQAKNFRIADLNHFSKIYHHSVIVRVMFFFVGLSSFSIHLKILLKLSFISFLVMGKIWIIKSNAEKSNNQTKCGEWTLKRSYLSH